jgi:hypothetical protein
MPKRRAMLAIRTADFHGVNATRILEAGGQGRLPFLGISALGQVAKVLECRQCVVQGPKDRF